jgi:hypothetical protein
MLPKSQDDLAKVIVESWKRSRSNYIVISPPMSGERNVILKITTQEFVYSVVGELAERLAIAKLDTADFTSEYKFACAVAKKWKVEEHLAGETDASTILELACQAVVARSRVPIIIIQRFHEALHKLGEDIGTTLRNLEHSHRLKTVVTMPVSLQTLRERWGAMKKDEAPFLASDWGQGHTHKLLKGYSINEIESLGAEFGLDNAQCTTLHAATAGTAELIEALIEEVGTKRRAGLDSFLQSRSVDLCQRMVRWLDAKAVSHVYKKNIVNLMCSGLYGDSVGQVRFHDWNSIILNKNGSLNFYMLAWAAKDELQRISGHTWLVDLNNLLSGRDFSSALEIVEISGNTDRDHFAYWKSVGDSIRLCQLFTDIYSSDVDWDKALFALDNFKERVAEIPSGNIWLKELENWRPVTKLLASYLLARKADTLLRFERYVCCNRQQAKGLIAPLLQLLGLRLHLADSYSPFQSLQSILTIPETLLQIYAYHYFEIEFWDYKGLPEGYSRSMSDVAGKPYELRGGVLGYSDLAHLILLHSLEANDSLSLVSDDVELKRLLEFYEVRKDLAHSTTFIDEKTYFRYRDFCSGLISKFVQSRELGVSALNIERLFALPTEMLKYAPQLTEA